MAVPFSHVCLKAELFRPLEKILRETLIMVLRSVLLTLVLPIFVLLPAHGADEADLQRLELTGACPDCDLSGADLQSSHLIGADLRGANLQGANLAASNLEGADLTGANLTGANLSNAFLTNAVFQSAVLDEADLSGSALYFTDVTDASLENINIADAQVVGTPISVGGAYGEEE